MNQLIPEPLLKKFSDNKFVKIYQEKGPWKERQVAIFVATVNDEECMRDYRYTNLPVQPTGFEPDWREYKKCKKEDKSETWLALLKKYPGYFKSLFEIEAKNNSNEVFLREMVSVFERENMTPYVVKVKELLKRYDIEKQ